MQQSLLGRSGRRLDLWDASPAFVSYSLPLSCCSLSFHSFLLISVSDDVEVVICSSVVVSPSVDEYPCEEEEERHYDIHSCWLFRNLLTKYTCPLGVTFVVIVV